MADTVMHLWQRRPPPWPSGEERSGSYTRQERCHGTPMPVGDVTHWKERRACVADRMPPQRNLLTGPKRVRLAKHLCKTEARAPASSFTDASAMSLNKLSMDCELEGEEAVGAPGCPARRCYSAVGVQNEVGYFQRQAEAMAQQENYKGEPGERRRRMDHPG